MRKLSDSLEGDLPLYLSDFQKAFPDFACQYSIYFLVSLGAFDGAVRSVNGDPALLFGVDVIARIHPQDELGVFFDHELLHIYHRQLRAWQAAWATRSTVRFGKKDWRPM
jgi:hypothetical protein